MILMTVTLEPDKASLAAAAAALGVAADDVDATFGLVPIDPDRGLYAAKVRHDAVPERREGKEYRGPYSNPKIASFGPPKKRG
jgi:hypothetical protein